MAAHNRPKFSPQTRVRPTSGTVEAMARQGASRSIRSRICSAGSRVARDGRSARSCVRVVERSRPRRASGGGRQADRAARCSSSDRPTASSPASSCSHELLADQLRATDLPAFERAVRARALSRRRASSTRSRVKVLGTLLASRARSRRCRARARAVAHRRHASWQRRAACVAFTALAPHGDAALPGLAQLDLHDVRDGRVVARAARSDRGRLAACASSRAPSRRASRRSCAATRASCRASACAHAIDKLPPRRQQRSARALEARDDAAPRDSARRDYLIRRSRSARPSRRSRTVADDVPSPSNMSIVFARRAVADVDATSSQSSHTLSIATGA